MRVLTFLLVNEEKGDGDLCLFFLALTHCVCVLFVYVHCTSLAGGGGRRGHFRGGHRRHAAVVIRASRQRRD